MALIEANEETTVPLPMPARYVIGAEGVIAYAEGSMVIATGARYRKLGVPEEDRFQGAGLY